MLNFRFLEKMIFFGEHEDIVDIFGVSFQNLTIWGYFLCILGFFKVRVQNRNVFWGMPKYLICFMYARYTGYFGGLTKE